MWRSNARFEAGHGALGFCDRCLVVAFGAELQQHFCVVDVAPQFFEHRDGGLEARSFFGDALRFLRVVPKSGRERLLAETIDVSLQFVDVKDAPLAS